MSSSQDTPTPQDLRNDARNALRLASVAPRDRLKSMLMHAANEFLNKAADLEAASIPPTEAIEQIRTPDPSNPDY
jgi:hypothetical protein